MKKETKNLGQGSHNDAKKSVKPVESAETAQLREEAAVTESLKQQALQKRELEAALEAEENKNRVIDSKKETRHTKASYSALIARYKKENPIKYEMKKAHFEKVLASLTR